ncbi:MAG: T9SS type A sorting domain-containing protein, partial [Fidelibacterota bacterium]
DRGEAASNAVNVILNDSADVLFPTAGLPSNISRYIRVDRVNRIFSIPEGGHTLDIVYSGSDPSKYSIVDYLIIQPITERKVWVNPQGDTLVLERKIETTTGIEEGINYITPPEGKRVNLSSFPNPFNNTTRIEYEIPTAVNVRMEVFNILGQKVDTLVNGPKMPGTYEIQFSVKNLSSGLYLCKLEIEGKQNKTIKLIVLK